MRLIKLSDYDHTKMQLARHVYDGKHRILLAAGNTIHPKYLEKLRELGIAFLIVEDAESRGITLEEMLDMPTWMGAIQGLQDAFAQVAAHKPLPLVSIQKIAGQLLLEVKRRKAVLLIPSTTIANELRLYAHAVNVTLLALQIGKLLRYNDLQLRNLALGSLLHDIGKAVAADEKNHPEAGFHILRAVRELSVTSAHIAFQHHETLDGKGYPRGLGGSEILEFAQVCGAANYYENLVSIQSVPPHEALEMLMTLYGTKYLEPVVKAFVNGVPSYPPGTIVRLNSGESAIVVRIDSHMQRPVVRVLSTEREIDLAENPTVMITGILAESNVE